MVRRNVNMMRNVLVVGATSSLAHALCHEMASKGWNLLLAGRDEEELKHLRNDVVIRYGVLAETILLDLSDPNFVPDPLLFEANGIGEINTVVIAAGEAGDTTLRSDAYEIDKMGRVNYLSPIKLLAAFADRAEQLRKGDMVVIGSVAGDRGRRSDYTYGSAKGGLAVYASGLRSRLATKGCHVMTVKPGHVDTPLTYTLKSGLIAPRELVARQIVRGLERKTDILYTPPIWRLIMLATTLIPETIFKKMRL